MGLWENKTISEILPEAANDEQFSPEIHKAWEKTVANVLRTLYAREGILWILVRNKLNPADEVEILNKIRPEYKLQNASNDDVNEWYQDAA